MSFKPTSNQRLKISKKTRMNQLQNSRYSNKLTTYLYSEELFNSKSFKNIIDKNLSNSLFQMKNVCRNLLESYAKSQYSSVNEIFSSPSNSSLSSHTPEMNTSETESDTSENGGTSLLHQALKRKRSDSETEQLFKRQFFLTTAPPNHYFNTTVTNVAQQSTGKTVFRPGSSVLTTASKFEPKFITRPLQSPGVFTQTGTTRPIFHIIQSPNRNLKLSATHVELCQLLQQNNSSTSQPLSVTTTNEPVKMTNTTTVAVKEEPK